MTGAGGVGPLRFTISEQDLVDSTRLAARRQFRVLQLLGLGAILVGVALWLLDEPSIGLAGIVAGLLAILAGRLRFISRWALRRRVGAVVGSACEIEFGERGIAYEQTGVRGEIDWAIVTGLEEDERVVFVMQGGVPRLGIPKRVFSSRAELERFRDLVAAGIAARRGG